MTPTSNPRVARGRGRFSIDRIPYVIEHALPILKDFKNIVLVEANDPVAFFAYPNKPSMLKPEGCEVHRVTNLGENSVAALEALAGALGAKPADIVPQKPMDIAKPTGALNHASIAQAIAMAIPENAIVVDESVTRAGSSSRRRQLPTRTTGCRTWAARSASRRRLRLARPLLAPTAR